MQARGLRRKNPARTLLPAGAGAAHRRAQHRRRLPLLFLPAPRTPQPHCHPATGSQRWQKKKRFWGISGINQLLTCVCMCLCVCVRARVLAPWVYVCVCARGHRVDAPGWILPYSSEVIKRSQVGDTVQLLIYCRLCMTGETLKLRSSLSVSYPCGKEKGK